MTIPAIKREVELRGGSLRGCHNKSEWVQRLAEVLAAEHKCEGERLFINFK